MNSFSRRFINRLTDTSQMIASNLYSGAQRVVSAVIPQSVRRRVRNFTNWLTGNVEPEQIPQVINEVERNIEETLPRRRPEVINVTESRSSLQNWARQYKIEGFPVDSPEEFLELTKQSMTNILRNKRKVKVKMVLKCLMYRFDDFDHPVPAQFSSDVNLINLRGTDVDELYDTMAEKILENYRAFLRKGSGWVFHSVVHLKLHTAIYDPLRASSFTPLPKWIADKKACINMKNEDSQCFKWSILRALNPTVNHQERVGDLRSKEDSLNMNGIEYPVSLHDINKFEKQNLEISVNVYSYEDEKNKFYPLRITNEEKSNHVDLLYLTNEEKCHYVLIKTFSRLMSSQISKHHGKKYFCKRCINAFGREDLLENHKKYCDEHDPVNLIMPKKGSVLQFINDDRKIKVPVAVFADFESILEPIKEQQTTEKNEEESYTVKTQKHIPCSFYYIIKCFDDDVFQPIERKYTGENAEKVFVDMITEDIIEIHQKYYQEPVPLKITEEEEKKYKRQTLCWICDEKFTHKNHRVRDHCHFTGKFRGAAHTKCNLKAKIPYFTPVYFHNLSGYDSHLFIKNLGKTEGNIDCIPNNEEKYISFSKYVKVGKNITHKIRFLDSFKFMSSSLDSLSKNLNEDQLNILSKFYPKKYLPLLRRKGVFPYEYLDSFERLKETCLPPKEKFYSSLNKEHISDEDYEHAKNVWKTFNMKTFKDYLELYNKIDVLLLADVFENFRDVCFKHYELDPAWYYTIPGLALDAMLKKSGVKLELLTDLDMLLMVEKGIRGGISMCSKRYSKANNKYMGKNYDKNKTSIYLIYIDANSLYPWAMSQLLPTCGFEWMDKKELEEWNRIPCFLEVDLEYPKELHDLHNDFPLAPEKLKIEKVEKLMLNLNDKENYVIHHEVLKTYLDLGLKIKKIHRGIKFNETDDIKKYIDLNIELRKNAKNDFEKDFFKLMMNSVFGKTMENLRNRVDVQLVNDAVSCRYKKLVAKPNYHHTTIFDENLVAVHMKKTSITYNKPVYLGMSILDISKTLMYKTLYNHFKKKYGGHDRMCYTDTDSFILEIETDDLYEDIACDVDIMYDMSGYPKEHDLYSAKNKKVLGMFKDELNGGVMTEMCGLGAKTYAYEKIDIKIDENEKLMWEGNGEDRRCKGVKKSVVKNELNLENYKNCLFKEKDHYRTMGVLRSRGHEIYTEVINKKALGYADDKRYILEDKINTLAWGHYRISKTY